MVGHYDPKTVPCGTPDKTFTFFDVSPSTTVLLVSHVCSHK